jgi:hypothetical protein
MLSNSRNVGQWIGRFGGGLWVLIVVAALASVAMPMVRAQDLPTLTPTPDRRVVNEIIAPHSGDAVAGFTAIQGTALIPGFRRYDIHISESGAEDWLGVMTGTDIIRNGTLYLLNTTAYADGFYDLRVRAIDGDGNYTETFVRDLEIRNANPPTPTPQFNELGTPLPPALTPTPPTPTPTPEYISFIPGGQGIFSSQDGEVIRGAVPVIGTVNGFPRNPFAHYELYLSESGFEAWEQLIVSDRQIWQNTIYTLDTTVLADGEYDLRLRIVYADGNYDEFEVRRLFVANNTYVFVPTPTATPIRAGILRPLSNANVSGIVEFVGGADTTNFVQWELAWRSSGTLPWTTLVTSGERVPLGGVLATLDLNQLPVGAYDFRLRIVEQDGRRLDYIVPQLRVLRPPPAATPTPTPFG